MNLIQKSSSWAWVLSFSYLLAWNSIPSCDLKWYTPSPGWLSEIQAGCWMIYSCTTLLRTNCPMCSIQIICRQRFAPVGWGFLLCSWTAPLSQELYYIKMKTQLNTEQHGTWACRFCTEWEYRLTISLPHRNRNRLWTAGVSLDLIQK